MSLSIHKTKLTISILKKIKPSILNVIKKKNYDFISEKHLDSFDVLNLIIEIEKKTKKKIDPSKLTSKSFKNVNTISKLI